MQNILKTVEKKHIYPLQSSLQVKGISKQDPEANIWAQERCEWGVEKTPQ